MATVEQLRAARALLGWSQTELASRAGLSLPTVKRVEGGFGPNVSDEARLKLQQALEAAGLEFRFAKTIRTISDRALQESTEPLTLQPQE